MLESIFQGDDDAHLPTYIYIHVCVCVYSRTREKENRDGRRNQVEAGWFGREKGERVHKIVGVTI